MKGARGLLISVTGGDGLTLYDVDEAASRIRQEVDDEANIILGATFEPALEEAVRVSVVATGIDQAANLQIEGLSARNLAKKGVGLALVAHDSRDFQSSEGCSECGPSSREACGEGRRLDRFQGEMGSSNRSPKGRGPACGYTSVTVSQIHYSERAFKPVRSNSRTPSDPISCTPVNQRERP